MPIIVRRAHVNRTLHEPEDPGPPLSEQEAKEQAIEEFLQGLFSDALARSDEQAASLVVAVEQAMDQFPDIERSIEQYTATKAIRRQAGIRSGAHRRMRAQTQRQTILSALATIKRRRPHLSQQAVARCYLEEHDPGWHAGTDWERARKVDTLLRKLRRQRTADMN